MGPWCNNCAGSVAWIWRMCCADLMHEVLFCSWIGGKWIDPICCGGRIFRLKFRDLRHLQISKAYVSFLVGRIVWCIVKISHCRMNDRDGIRYLRFTQFLELEDTTGFWTLWYVWFVSRYAQLNYLLRSMEARASHIGPPRGQNAFRSSERYPKPHAFKNAVSWYSANLSFSSGETHLTRGCNEARSGCPKSFPHVNASRVASKSSSHDSGRWWSKFSFLMGLSLFLISPSNMKEIHDFMDILYSTWFFTFFGQAQCKIQVIIRLIHCHWGPSLPNIDFLFLVLDSISQWGRSEISTSKLQDNLFWTAVLFINFEITRLLDLFCLGLFYTWIFQAP